MIVDPVAAAEITRDVYSSFGERGKAVVTEVMNAVAAELAESPEAWRGAATVCTLLVDILADGGANISGQRAGPAVAVCMLIASHPAAVAAARRHHQP